MQLPPQDMSGLLFRKREYYKSQDQEPCEFSRYHGGGIYISGVSGQDAVK